MRATLPGELVSECPEQGFRKLCLRVSTKKRGQPMVLIVFMLTFGTRWREQVGDARKPACGGDRAGSVERFAARLGFGSPGCPPCYALIWPHGFSPGAWGAAPPGRRQATAGSTITKSPRSASSIARAPTGRVALCGTWPNGRPMTRGTSSGSNRSASTSSRL